MEKVTVSAKYQIVIPLSIRKEFGIKPGQSLFFVKLNDSIQIVPQIPLNQLFGKLKLENTEIVRDEDRL